MDKAVDRLVAEWKTKGAGIKTEEEARQFFLSALQKPSSSSSKKKPSKVNKSMISSPKDFQHLSHVGWTENGYDASNIREDWRTLLNKAGIDEDLLQDRETAEFISQFIKEQGGLDGVVDEDDDPATFQIASSSPVPAAAGAGAAGNASPPAMSSPQTMTRQEYVQRQQLSEDAKAAKAAKKPASTGFFNFGKKEAKFVPKTDPTYIDPVIVALQNEIERKGFQWDEARKRADDLTKDRDQLTMERDFLASRARSAEDTVAVLMSKIEGMDPKELTASLQNEREQIVTSLNRQLAETKAAMEQLRKEMEDERERALVKQRLDFEMLVQNSDGGLKNAAWFKQGSLAPPKSLSSNNDSSDTSSAGAPPAPPPPPLGSPPPPLGSPPPPPPVPSGGGSAQPSGAPKVDLLAGLQQRQLRKVEVKENRIEDLAVELAKALQKRLKSHHADEDDNNNHSDDENWT